MNTWRESILQGVVTILNGAAIGAGVYRSRVEALAIGELPAVVVKPGMDSPDNSSRGIVVRKLEIELEFHARSTAANPAADSLADPVIAAAHAALMADQTLGAKVARLIEEPGMGKPEWADGDNAAVMIPVIYTAVYMTPANDLTHLA